MASLIVDPDEDILTQVCTAQVTPSDLYDVMGRELTKQEVEFLSEFEHSWKNFVCSKRGKLPAGRREVYLGQLQEKVNQLNTTRNNVEDELNKQLAFFHESQDSAEKELKAKIQREKEEYQALEKKLTQELKEVLDAQALQEETLPWNFFLSAVDADAVARVDQVQQDRSRTVKPSTRAMHLMTQQTSSGRSQERSLHRAFQVDYS